MVLPLKTGFFSEKNITIHVPNNSVGYLLHAFGLEKLDRCGFSKGGTAWNHREERIIQPVVVVPCKELTDLIPFSKDFKF